MNHASVFKKNLSAWLPLLVYLALIFGFSQQSNPTGNVDVPISDKLIHFLEYLPLPYLFFRALRSVNAFQERYFWRGILLALLFAASDEFHQSFIPLREVSIFDFLADATGIFLGSLAFLWLKRKQP